MTIPFDLLVSQVKLPGSNSLTDLGIKGGVIAAIGNLAGAAAKTTVQAQGRLLLPPFVEPHVHLDTTLTAGEPAWNESGTLAEGISIWSARKKQLSREDVLERAERTLKLLIGYGVLYVRAMVDIGDPKLTAFRAVLELKEAYRDRIHMQIIAFPQDGLIACPDNEARMEEALRLGADGVSAVPHLERTREEGVLSLNKAFTLAARFGALVHVFCDETDDEHSRYLEVCASLALATGLTSKVTAAHANAATYYNEPYFQKLLGLVKQSGLSIVACPLINSVMQGRYDAYPKGRGITRIQDFHRAGINVALAHDDILTPFYPLGTGNPLDAAHMAAHLAHMCGRQDLNDIWGMTTFGGAKALQLSGYGFEQGKPKVGNPASFLLFDAADPAELIRTRNAPRYVIHKGQVVAETMPTVTKWVHPAEKIIIF
ncbi:amidohydrolase family protein [Paenibacillus glycanilyticus]|uniref:Cytosine deaminase n=1 Tax=Paenibacillus glycanilyticus TaxID=126569 RepID=A0ABQ6GG75_9BACL|nr:amidohydrolase family protein [Paenibacillus glycanilyticus]GLX69838.1 cytosine deaminase [Paenibacillus glycanilyticus]